MRQATKKPCGKALASFLIATITLQVAMAGSVKSAYAVESEQDYIIVFDNTKKCQEFAEEAQATETNPEGEELLKDAGMAVAELTKTEARKLE